MRTALFVVLALLAPAAAASLAAPAPATGEVAALLLEVAAPIAVGAAPDLAALPARTLREEVLAYYALAGAVPTPQGLARLDEGLATLPAEVQAPVARLLGALNAAVALRGEAFAALTEEEVAWAVPASLRLDALTDAEAARLLAIAARVDLPKMVGAGALVLAAIEDALPALRAAAALPGAESIAWSDPAGLLEVTGTGPDVHAADRTFLVDLGGHDLWSNNAGAMAPSAVIEAFPGCFTTGALDCTALYPKRNGPTVRSLVGRTCSANLADPVFLFDDYTADANAALAAQAAQPDAAALLDFASVATPASLQVIAAATEPDTGCAPRGADDAGAWADDFWMRGAPSDSDARFVALGLDLAGDDVFAPPKDFNFMNDGRNPSGCDTRSMGEEGKLWSRNVTAGSSFAGLGFLWDEAGADFYGGRSITQGVAHLGAVAALVDRGAGADRYEGIRFAQGMAFVAAVGLLYDDGGDDRYELKNLIPLWNEFEAFNGCDVSTRDGQGRSNIFAVGALVDRAGDDVYYVQDHIAEGLLLPGASRDDATTTQGSTGFRLNLGPSPLHDLEALGRGVLWDRAGSDAYSRPGRGDGCFHAGGTFLDEGAAPLASLRPCS